jgi:predicted ABC-type ATPase
MIEAAWSELRQVFADDQPVLLVLAGPNGAGKSTFFDVYLAESGLPFVNADRLASKMSPANPLAVAYQAAELAETERRSLLAGGRSFCMETVFSDPAGAKLRLLKDAQAVGYRVVLIFIGLAGPELSLARVIQRVEEGGHDVPDEKLYSRFPRTLQNLKEALRFVDLAILFDNSMAELPYRLVALFRDGVARAVVTDPPGWLEQVMA